MSLVTVKKAYDDHDVESVVTGLECLDKSLAVQSSRDEVDINTIVRRFGLTGQLPHDVSVPQFVDFDRIYDYHSAMNLIAEARDSFMAMPAHVRSRFDNDPQGLVAFVSDPANLEEMRKLGIALPKAVDDPLLEAVRALKPSEHVSPEKPV